MHPALEKLTLLTGRATNKEWADDHYDMRVRMANALPALIAALVEIEAKVDNDLLGGSTNNFADGYQAAIRDIHQIINRHLEPLK